MKIKLIALIFLTTYFCQFCYAQPNINQQLMSCQSIKDNKARLVCYDQIEINKEQNTTDELTKDQESSTFPTLIADLDEPNNLFFSYGNLDFLGREVRSVLLGGGKRHEVKNFNLFKSKPLTFNVFGQIRSQFDVDQLDTRNNRGGALINTDFSVGGEIIQSFEKWNWRLSYTHRSTHLGDEFIIDNPNYIDDRINLSYETLRWTAHKKLNHWDIYAGVGFITRSEPGNLDKTSWQLGWQYQGNTINGFKPIWAVDLKSWGAFDWNINLNMRAGIEIQNWANSPFQLFLEYQDGHSPYGQFYNEDLTFTGLTFMQSW